MCPCGCGSDEDEAIEKPVQVVMIPCKYCATLFSQTATFCPNCGAKRTSDFKVGRY